jgi:hypothetical protein
LAFPLLVFRFSVFFGVSGFGFGEGDDDTKFFLRATKFFGSEAAAAVTQFRDAATQAKPQSCPQTSEKVPNGLGFGSY